MTKISELRVGDTGTIKFEVEKRPDGMTVLSVFNGNFMYPITHSVIHDHGVATLIRAPKPIQVGDTVGTKSGGVGEAVVLAVHKDKLWLDYKGSIGTYEASAWEHIND